MEDSNEDNVLDNPAIQNHDGMIRPSSAGANVVVPLRTATTTGGMSASTPVSPVFPNRLNSPSTAIEMPRVPSAALSITKLDFAGSNNEQHPNSAVPHVELIKFD